MGKVKIPKNKYSQFEADLIKFDSVFFSSKFGKGKTTFLKYFFENKDEYLVISLNPVLYSANNNTDVFKLLEVDIATELLRNLTNETLLPKEYIIAEIVKNRSEDIASHIVQQFEKLGKPLHKGLLKLIKAVHELKVKSQEELKYLKEGNYGAVQYYLDMKEDELPDRGNIFSGVISNVLLEDKRTKVLLIDDLDRLDPNHLFRLLNIFSNSFFEDNVGHGAHKRLGFDKIILVGHYDNIKGIFHHQYGKNVDFGGYFNKFHEKVHNFDYEVEAKVFIENNLQMEIDVEALKNRKLNCDRLEMVKQVISEIVFVLFVNNHIDWRTLHKKIAQNPISERHYPEYVRKGGISPMSIVLFYLSDIMETPQNLLKAFIELTSFGEFAHLRLHSHAYRQEVFDQLIPLSIYNKSLGNFTPRENEQQIVTIRFRGKDYRITTQLILNGEFHEYIARKKSDNRGSHLIIDHGKGSESPTSMNYYDIWGIFLSDTMEKANFLFRQI